MADAANRTNTETSSQAIYRQVCEGDPVAVTYYLKTADPEDANHGILSYVESLQAEVKNLTERNHHLHSRLTYEKAQRIALTERLQELDPPEEVHGT